jgi:hypothetical protein
MAYATPTDIADRLGRELDETEARIVDARLGDAELLIKSRVKDLNVQVSAGTIDQAVVVMVESDAVLRLIRNPEGYTTETDGNYSYAIDQSVATGRLRILDEEWALLGVRASVFTIAPKMSIPYCGPEGANICDDFQGGSGGSDNDDTAVWA